MKFTIKRNQLLKPLQLLNGVVERRQTLPILGNILLVLDQQELSLTGTDLEVELSGQTPVEQVMEPGEITVPAKKLLDICRALNEDAIIEFKVVHHKLYLQTDNSRFSLTTLPAVEFPKVKESMQGIEFTINIQLLKQLIERTQFAMAHQDVRYYLNGCLWEIQGNTLTMVATDGHRLSRCVIQLSEDTALDSAKVIVPRKAVLEIVKLLQDEAETITIVMHTNSIRVVANDFVLTSKLIDGRYPDYQNVIPKGGQDQLVIERDVLKPILSRVAILSNEKYRGVRLSLETGMLNVTANNPEHEEAEEKIPVDFSGASIELGVNVTYLLDVLNTLPKGSIVFTFSGADKGIIVQHQNDSIDVLNVIMPMRL
jgi:DNA polymerase-3 subunit beta